MPQFHRLDAAADARFLQARVADPITRTPFRPTNSVVMCQTCGLVSLRETWEALDGCPNGHTAAAPWDPAAALASGDGARTATPRVGSAARPAPVEPARNRWLTPLLLAVGVAGLLALAVVVFGMLRNDDPAPVETATPVASEPTGPQAVIIGEPGLTEGALSGSDFADASGRYQDLYTFAADSSGRVLSFTVTADDFFPDLVVQTPDGDRVEAETIAADEDSGTRTVTVANLRAPGLYRVRLTSRQPADTGAYTLRVRREDPVRPLSAGGAAVQAELGKFSERADGFFRDRYQFRGTEGRAHTVTVRSSAFAPTLQMSGPGGAVSGETGRAGGVVTFVFTPSKTGTHTLLVSSQSRAQRGAYSVQLAVEKEREDQAAAPSEDRTLGPTLRANGSATRDSLASGESKAYTVRGRTGDRVRLEIRAEGFTPSLVLVGPDGSRTASSPDGDRARIRATLPTAGAYRVIVGATGGAGEYRLTLEQEAAVTSDDIPRMPGADTPQETPGRDEGEPARTPPVQDRPNYRPQPIGDQGTR